VKVRVVWCGRAAASPHERQVETYRSRVARRWPAEDIVVKPVAGGRDADPHRVLALEGDRIRQHLPDGWTVVVLDEYGERLTSVAFAERLAELERRALAGVVFVVGSDLGLDAALTAGAAFRISLSDMTLPHLLARLVLWEQLFRATTILGGGGYHRLVVQ
jgi:23S rRNA (pseudouridine1915-N3)-methyltransferase